MALLIDLALLAAAVVLSIGGCVLLALSQPRNMRRVSISDTGVTTPAWFRVVGWCGVVLSCAPLFARDGASFAMLLWPLTLAGSAVFVAMVLAFKPSLLRLLSGTR
ncbi:MAG: DUF3325 family protein [Pseudomonadota bacterium]